MTQPSILIPSAKEVNAFHSKSDVDTDANAQHHTLGIRADQASPGHHDHNGTNSKLISSAPGGADNTAILAVDAKIPADLPTAYQDGMSLMTATVPGSPAWPAIPSLIITHKIGVVCSQECRSTVSNARYYRSWDTTGPSWRAWV